MAPLLSRRRPPPKSVLVVSSGNRLARLLADGTVDASFDGDGQLFTSPMTVQDFTIDAAGNHIVVGYIHNGTDWDIAVRRYDALGQLDTGYATGGTAIFDFGGGSQGDFGRTVALHGDLWPSNLLVVEKGEVRLIDWDHAGVGPATYDLSNMLMRLPVGLRLGALADYREAGGTAGRFAWGGCCARRTP